MIRGLIVMVTVMMVYIMVIQLDAPSPQQEAEAVADDVNSAQIEAKRQARLARREQWLQAEMKKRGCTP